MTEKEYNDKVEEVKKNFSKDFFDKRWHTDATFSQIFNMLLRNENPYKLIELLIEQRGKMFEKLHELIQLMPVSGAQYT